MASQKELTRGQTALAIEVSPETIDAGAEMTHGGTLSCTPPCDLSGQSIAIKDEGGAELGVLDILDFEDDANVTGELVVTAPLQPGEYSWLAVCPAHTSDGASYEESTASLSFTVKAHTTRIVAWEIPTTIVAGEKFKMKVGIKCSAECVFANRNFAIHDHEGNACANGTLVDQIWPGTSALYFAEIECDAPADQGLYHWKVTSLGSDEPPAHEEGSTEFSLRVVPQPECSVTIEAVDKSSGEPLKSALVALHPYKTVADESGVANIQVAKGAYKLFVSHPGYLVLALPIELTADITKRAELELEPEVEKN